MPESGLPIRVYEEHNMWHVDYGEGVTEDHTSEVTHVDSHIPLRRRQLRMLAILPIELEQKRLDPEITNRRSFNPTLLGDGDHAYLVR